jgi:hypothetical protein
VGLNVGSGKTLAVTGTATLPAATTLGGATAVSVTGTQTLTNKTLTNPAINGFTGDTSVINIGSGQLYKDSNGRVGINTTSAVWNSAEKLVVSQGDNAPAIVGYNTNSAGAPVFVSWNSAASGAREHIWFADSAGGSVRAKLTTDGSNGLQFLSGSTEAMRITSAGNVGIGTSSPLGKLHSTGGVFTTGLDDPTDGGASGSFQMGYGGGTGVLRTFASSPIRFETAGVERMRIDSAGNVGIGTSSPATKLHVSGAGNVVTFNRSGVATLLFGLDSAKNEIYSRDGGTGNFPLAFFTGTTERMRIDSSGNLLVGTTSLASGERFNLTKSTTDWVQRTYNANASPKGIAVIYDGAGPNGTVNTFLYCQDIAAVRAEIRSNGGIANFSANDVNLSDRREKTNFAPAKSYLETICAIPVQTFNYIDQNLEEDPGLTLGVVAQDVQEVAPELVMESNWGTQDEPKMRLSIYQTDLQYALMKCIQEQQAIINDLKARLDAANL